MQQSVNGSGPAASGVDVQGRLLDVVVIGGGIAGLSTAWYLQEEAAGQGKALDYALLEAADRWGGKIRTEMVETPDGGKLIIEGGPDAFITQKPWGLQLARKLGMEERLLNTNDERRTVYVLNKGKPTPLPDGVLLIVPTKFMPFALSPLISPFGKLRMGMDLFIPRKSDGQDETLADFIRRRLGNEALDKIAEPLMSGIYNAEAERQSLLATFPRFRTLEEKHGSLIRGMLASRRTRQSKPAPAQASGSSRPPSIFVSMRDGMEEMTEEIRAQLTGDCRLSTAVQALEATADGYRLTLENGEVMGARTVVLAVPAHVANRLLAQTAPDAAAELSNIRYVSTGTISMAFRRDEIGRVLDGFGVVIPRSEERRINAVTVTSIKFDHRAPDDYVLLRAFFGGSRRPEMMMLGDEELTAAVREELAEILGITAPPTAQRIFRWMDANPQYDVGHLERVDAIEAALPAGLYVTGSPYRGVGIPDCIHQSQQTAQQVIAQLGQQALAGVDRIPA